MRFSQEQIDIYSSLIEKKQNVIVDAVAGSGKTTTIKKILTSESNVLVLLYNKRLCEEAKISLGDTSAKIYTIHSSSSFIYNKVSRDDESLLEIVNQNLCSISYSPKIIILDEAQDISIEIYKYIKKLISDISSDETRLLVLGDKLQCVYRFKGSDPKYLTEADKMYPSKGEWVRKKLSTSYRCCKDISQFVNSFLGYDRISSVKEGERVKYYIDDPNDLNERLYSEIEPYIKRNEYDKFAIIARSYKGTHPKAFINYLISKDIPVHYPVEGGNSDPNNKVYFSTIPTFKGMEREMIIFFGIDSGFYQKDIPESCPDDIYVALTRAKTKLILIHDKKNDYFPFFDKDILSKCYIYGSLDLKEKYYSRKIWNVKDLVKYNSISLKEKIVVKDVSKGIKLKISLNNNFENLYLKLISVIFRKDNNIPIPEFNKSRSAFKKDPRLLNPQQPSDIIYSILIYMSIVSGYKNLSFLDIEKDYPSLVKCAKRLDFLKDKEFSFDCETHYPPKTNSSSLIFGNIDIISQNSLYKLKLGDITSEDINELVLFMSMKYLEHEKNFDGYILDIKNGTTISVKITKNEDCLEIIKSFLSKNGN